MSSLTCYLMIGSHDLTYDMSKNSFTILARFYVCLCVCKIINLYTINHFFINNSNNSIILIYNILWDSLIGFLKRVLVELYVFQNYGNMCASYIVLTIVLQAIKKAKITKIAIYNYL